MRQRTILRLRLCPKGGLALLQRQIARNEGRHEENQKSQQQRGDRCRRGMPSNRRNTGVCRAAHAQLPPQFLRFPTQLLFGCPGVVVSHLRQMSWRTTAAACFAQRQHTPTIERRGRKGRKEKLYSFAAFAAFAFL